ncbi:MULTISPECIES: TIGR03619 family F420-dependent LLM class oxidoreductase [Saccharopolyspora]|uniref:LLM class F420-dependent oxidoreductase n=1 Tax=Saccharopolyspora gregorii TaxID=33914 RepID=A0ABP6RK09_9PSEU|nr:MULTISPECIES: TIGR03619 family F420-dependent LLM class oxidoreductase [Saccharopolyspora]MCA1194082.1 TIGR03619 family F420-dependent LLM class oxidoreductase [Saccharopolyspora sp. 6V]MCA1227493.1 TIGR03619 family F420-dependent LLM class oxidoreductase [Saccharopolyspora sp. 6M]MCA1281032.1 TIGR03619 family F420-dependent LLM class oxidoreductase [Saccharopolyspora sp. 7B]
MRHGIVLFTSDRGITPGQAAQAAEQAGFDTFYVPEHTHIPIKRTAAHPGTGGADLPDDRYLRTLDPWVSLSSAAALTTRIELATAVALPVESDPIALAKTIASLDLLSGGRVVLGAGFGWNTDELADHQVPAHRRRTALREHLEAMRALWTEEEAEYSGEFVRFGPSWAYPKPSRIPVLIGAGAGPKTFAWIAAHADGWITTPADTDVPGGADRLRTAWAEAGRAGAPEIRVLATRKPTPDLLAEWADCGVAEAIWGLPDAPADDVRSYLARHAERLGIGRS